MEDANKQNKNLNMINTDLWEEIQIIEEDIENWKKKYESMKQLHSNALQRIKDWDHKISNKNGIINDFIDNKKHLNNKKNKAENKYSLMTTWCKELEERVKIENIITYKTNQKVD